MGKVVLHDLLRSWLGRLRPTTGSACLVVQKHLGADSLDLVELVMAFEEEFNIEIPDDVQESIRTVGDAVTHIKAHI